MHDAFRFFYIKNNGYQNTRNTDSWGKLLPSFQNTYKKSFDYCSNLEASCIISKVHNHTFDTWLEVVHYSLYTYNIYCILTS